MADFAAPLGLPELVLGGGLGVAYVEGEEAPSITQWGNVLLDACESLGVRSRVSVEPGRSIVAAAAITVYTLGTIKHIPGVRTYFSVDGGMSDNPRPVLYGSGLRVVPPACGRRPPRADGPAGRQALRVRRRARVRRAAARPTPRSATCWRCRSPARTASRWVRTTTASRGRRSCSAPMATPDSSSAARRSTTCSHRRLLTVTPGRTILRMSKWINMLLDLVRQVQASQRERDRIAGKTTRREVPPTEPVERGVRIAYTPDMDGDADPGEVVWAWVPYEEDPNRGKDRPVVVIGRASTDRGPRLAGIASHRRTSGATITYRSGPGHGIRSGATAGRRWIGCCCSTTTTCAAKAPCSPRTASTTSSATQPAITTSSEPEPPTCDPPRRSATVDRPTAPIP